MDLRKIIHSFCPHHYSIFLSYTVIFCYQVTLGGVYVFFKFNCCSPASRLNFQFTLHSFGGARAWRSFAPRVCCQIWPTVSTHSTGSSENGKKFVTCWTKIEHSWVFKMLESSTVKFGSLCKLTVTYCSYSSLQMAPSENLSLSDSSPVLSKYQNIQSWQRLGQVY